MQEYSGDQEQYWEKLQDFVADLKSLPVAINTEDANEQHYEVTSAAVAFSPMICDLSP